MDRQQRDAPGSAPRSHPQKQGPLLNVPPIPAPPSGALHRRILSLLYELLLLGALLMVGALPFVMLMEAADRITARPLLQLYLAGLAALYFGWQWLHGGQTLPMKTWRLKLVRADGGTLTRAHALKRMLFACAGTIALGAGFLWALVDPDRQFLHDRLAGTKIVTSDR